MDYKKSIPLKQAIETARIISEQYNIKSYKDWKNFIEKGIFIITPPPLGKSYLSFEETKSFVQSLGLKSMHEWKVYCDENHILDLSHPAKHYKNDWTSWSDFLGGEHKVPSKFMPFKDAVIYVRNLCIENCKEWQKYCDLGDRPKNIPHSPQKIYKAEWQGWNYFFGTGLYRQELYIETPDDELLGIIEDDIEWDLHHVEYLIELFREETDIDEEILEKYKEEPKQFLDGLRDYLRKYPREYPEDEE